jgi:protein-tyrosine phosphatase
MVYNSCLNDEELDFLGAPWPEYKLVAEEIGMDVLRLPTPEGLPPSLSPSILDEHLTTIAERYSLQGQNVLVHCRGGVGRAGVFACCWILRLGLCGNVMSQPTAELVERVVRLVRRRRSIKAIETFEQVRFLVAFIDHLKTKELMQTNDLQQKQGL